MNTNVIVDGPLEKLLMEHKKERFPHIKSFAAYLLEIARQRAEEDKRKG